MITILTGLPRSGKSYRAVWWIYSQFINPKSKEYSKHHFLYTNVGGFKHDKVNDILIQNPINDDIVKESIYLDWAVFYPHLQKLHEMAKADKPDDELLRYAAYHKLTPALFVIDEAYRFYLKKSDPVLVWWHGYHGHLGHDILIIIHRPSLMNGDYKSHTEEFIDAQPKSKAVFSNQFRYYFYSNDPYTPKNRYHTDKLVASPEIFALYQSGDLHKPKKIIYKFIGIALLAFIGFLMFAVYFSSSLRDRVKSNDSDIPLQNVSSDSLDQATAPVSSSLTGKSLLRVRCDTFSCARIDPAFEVHFIPRSYFDEILKTSPNKLLVSSTVHFMDYTYTDYLFQVTSDIVQFFPSWNIPHNYQRPSLSSASVTPFDSGVTTK